MILAALTLSYCSNSFTTGVESTFWEDHGFGHWRASLASSRSRGRSPRNWEGLQQVCDSTASRLGLDGQMSHHFNRAIVVSSALCKLGRWLDSYVTRAQLLTKNRELPDILELFLSTESKPNMSSVGPVTSQSLVTEGIVPNVQFTYASRYGRVNFVLASRLELLKEVQRFQVSTFQ